MSDFRAYRIHANGGFGEGRADTMSRDELDSGDVLVRVAYASVNYKDALTARVNAKIVRRLPLVAGVDLSGTVEESGDARYRAGDEVIVHNFGLAVDHDGGYAEYGRFPADWVVPLPAGLSLYESMALGVAGFAGNVLPFILRGVRLLGVNVNNPFETRMRLWKRLAGDLKPPHLARIARRIRFEELEHAFDGLLAARVTGRMVVDFSLR